MQRLRSSLPVISMVAEDVRELTSGIRTRAEAVGYQYAEVERRHRFRFLFDTSRVLTERDFIEKYLAEQNPFPRSAEIDPSNACNHDCSFCIYHSMHSLERSEMLTKDVLFRVIDELNSLGCKSLLFVGGGEPMTHPNTIDAIELAASYGFSVGLVTNGSLVGKHISRLKQSATYVRFSLDAASADTHFLLHRNDDFDKIVRNLNFLAKAAGSCTIGTGYFINDQNIHEIVTAARLVKESGADYIQFKSYSGMAMPPEMHEEVLAEIEKVLPLSDASFDVHVMERIFHNNAFQTRGYTKCHWQAFKTIINADGSVYLCAQKRTDPTGRIGNVNTSSLAEIWNGQQRQNVLNNLDLVRCPYCVHDTQNKTIEFLAHFRAPHQGFI